MGKMGKSYHVKRFATPWYYQQSKKEHKWTVRTSPGTHPISRSIPIALVIRDYLNLARNLAEAKLIVSEGDVKIDGRTVRDYRFPVGLMDIISFPKSDMYYLALPDNVKFMRFTKINKDQSSTKFLRLVGKTAVKGGNLQLNLEGGYNIFVPRESITQYNYETMGTVKLDLDGWKVLDYLPVKEGMYAIAVGGKNVGMHGKIKALRLEPYQRAKYSVATVSLGDTTFQTNIANLMVIGKDKPEIEGVGQ